jgi:DNA-binding NarL/FixJ family response regulator
VGVTVVIVDDHEGFRRMARRLLEEDGFEVVGEAGDGEAGLAAVETLRPQLVLLDVQLPDTDGIALASRLAASHPETVVVLTSVRPAAHYGDRLTHAAARGFVPKVELSGSMLLEMMAG